MKIDELLVRAVIFDFDGTLARLNIDFPLMREAVLKLIECYGVPLDGLANLFVLEMIDAGGKCIAEKHPAEEEPYRERARKLITAMEMEAAGKGGLLEGTRPMLSKLKSLHIKTGVVTRNCGAAISRIFPDIREFCDVVIPREQTPHVKPHPEHLRVALHLLNTVPQHSAIVGDHPMDIRGGREVGLFTIGVLTGTASREELLEEGPDLILEKAADLIDVLDTMTLIKAADSQLSS